jgi:putative ABC transport system ATP-binding protein
MIRVEDVFVVFYPGTALERVAVRSVNFTAKEGEIVSILGNSGSGRSTLLRFLAGHIISSFGKIRVDNRDITGQSISERSKIFSCVFYEHGVGTAGNLTVAENLAIAGMHHQSKSLFYPAIDKENKEMYYEQLKELDFMGMESLIDEKVGNISRAHRHVLAILIAIIKEARILLIDEHSTGLDREVSKDLLSVTQKIIKSKNITTIMAVNDPQFALDISDRLLVLNYGQVVADVDSEAKKNFKLGDIFESFNIVPPIKNPPNSYIPK